MTDEFDRILAATRPRLGGDASWATSEAGSRTLESVHRRLASGKPVRGRRLAVAPGRVAPRLALVGLAVVLAGTLALSSARGPVESPVAGSPGSGVPTAVATGPGNNLPPVGTGAAPLALRRPAAAVVTAYDNCDALLAGLREHTAGVGASGLTKIVRQQPVPIFLHGDDAISVSGTVFAASGPVKAGGFSPTNVQENGVDEPDLVKTDGRRIVSIAGGTLTVVDVATRTVTGRLWLDVTGNAAAGLLLFGDRALVTLQGPTASKLTLVDLAGTPRELGSIVPDGYFLEARMVGSTVRLVVQSAPTMSFPPISRDLKESAARNREVVAAAPLSAWQPTYQVTLPGAGAESRSVPCDRISHPDVYTGTSMLTVYTLDLTAGVDAVDAMTLVGDAGAVYSTPSSLYVASTPGALPCQNCHWSIPVAKVGTSTEIHRFDLTLGAPRYLGTSTVPGTLLNSYSLSDYQGYLRVVTTTAAAPGRPSVSAVRVLDQDTLRQVGAVGGLGAQERVYAVRFAGPIGYIVTFRQTDPLFVIDLRSPTAPRLTGELKITGNSAYLYPIGDGRLLGVGDDATARGATRGVQVRLFDVSDLSKPAVLSSWDRAGMGFAGQFDPHAFLYWPATGTVVLPLPMWSATSGSAVVLKVTADGLVEQGPLAIPAAAAGSWPGSAGIQRNLVVGGRLWSYSADGLLVSDLSTLKTEAWLPFSS